MEFLTLETVAEDLKIEVPQGRSGAACRLYGCGSGRDQRLPMYCRYSAEFKKPGTKSSPSRPAGLAQRLHRKRRTARRNGCHHFTADLPASLALTVMLHHDLGDNDGRRKRPASRVL